MTSSLLLQQCSYLDGFIDGRKVTEQYLLRGVLVTGNVQYSSNILVLFLTRFEFRGFLLQDQLPYKDERPSPSYCLLIDGRGTIGLEPFLGLYIYIYIEIKVSWRSMNTYRNWLIHKTKSTHTHTYIYIYICVCVCVWEHACVHARACLCLSAYIQIEIGKNEKRTGWQNRF